MNILILLIYIFLLCESNSKKLYNEIPSLLVQNGHLMFIAAYDKNITFSTSSSAGVSINNIDLVTTLNRAHNATKLVENYQKTFTSYVDRIDSLELRITDIPIRGDNSSVSSTFPIRRLRRSFSMLMKRVSDLEAALLQDDCIGNPCKNGGICQDMYKNYICHCPDGWQGIDCLEDVNECARFVGTDLGCQNGATCINKPGTYECLCQPGYVGIHCTRRKADCSTGGQELCGHGTCVQQNNQLGYKCICDQGWTTDGTNQACLVDVNECNLNHPSCSTNPKVPCINVPGSFYCGGCPIGYTGNGYYCSDINECETNNGGCSINPMVTCINTQGSRMCSNCPPGYEGDGISCTFRGLCNVNNGGCHHLAQCRDNSRISSTYVECICPTGYVGNGIGPTGCMLSSSPFNPCASNPCVNGDCSVNNVTGEYICTCRRNFTGRNCNMIKKDPCTTNPCLNGGTCRNVMGITFQCICKSGFRGTLCETEAPGCGGKLYGTSGILSYPSGDYETYGHRLSCSWTIETNSTKILNITFSKFDIEESTGCRSDWLQIHDGPTSASHPLGRFCGTNLPLGGKILTTHNIIYFWFRSNAGNAKTGFKLVWNATDPVCGETVNATSHGTIESPGSPANYPPNRDCYWRIIVPFGKRLQFHFFSLDIGNNADCDHDFIEFNNLFNIRNGGAFAKFCNSSNPIPFYSVSDGVEVHFHSGKDSSHPGFQMTYSVVEGTPGCGGIYTAAEGTINSAKPDSSTHNICEYKIQQAYKTRTKITFLNLDLHQTSSCTDEYIEIREGPNTDSPLIGRYCGNILPASYVSNAQITIISSISRDTSKWKIKYEKICGMKFFNTTGSFESPLRSMSKIDCIYQIEQPLGYIIELSIKVFLRNRPYSTVYCNNYIEIRDGDNEDAALIKKFCASQTITITSTSNHLWIRYFQRYNFLVSFEATYTSTNLGCGGILRNKLGNIASPVRPEGYYPPSLKCTWVIIAPPKSVIQLTWITFSLEQSYECSYDNVQIFDNNTELGMGGLIGKYCGSNLPPILMSSGNIMTIVFVTDVTIHMDGFLATYTFMSDSNICGGNYYTSAGVIKTPNYPDEYPASKDCKWTITVPSGQQILLNVTDFDLEYYISCRYDWLEIRNGGTSNSPLLGKYCGTKIPKQIPSHTNKLYLHFTSDPNRGGRGFKIIWSSTATGCGGHLTSPTGSIISPNYPEPYSRNTDCTWTIIVGAGSRIQVIFSDMDLEQNVQCNLDYVPDYVQLFDGLTINSKSLGKFCYKEDKPIVSTNHQMLVKFRADVAFQGRGFQLHYSTICNNTLSGFRGVIESPNFPNEYAQDLNCWWDIVVSDRNKINITFSHFELETSYTLNKTCISDYLEIKYLEVKEDYDEEPDYIRQGKYCGTDNPGQITLNSDHAQIHFVSDKWVTGSGFRLEWQLFGCGGYLTSNSGTIQTPNYPKPYSPSTKCEWHIEIDFGYSIQIEFRDVDIEKDSCEYDWIKIYNGPNTSSNVITKFCYQKKPIVISSTGNQMFIEFHSDYSYEGKGFMANYSSVPTKCGGRFTAPEGAIFSPNYPNNFDKNDTCFWLIEIDENHTIELSFEDADLPTNCDKNYIKVYDGPTEAYPVLKKVCSFAPNDTIKSTFNEMYIEFRTSTLHYTTKGFLAKYKKNCGSRLTTQGSGNIQVTHDELSVQSYCLWTIVSSDPSRRITLIITKMQMHMYDCNGENPVKIYGGETTESPLLKSYCGKKVPPPLVSDGSAITIELQQSMDFFATYSVFDSHCGGEFNAAEGFFATPGYPNKYPSDMECEWIINVAPGNNIMLTFTEFDILESEKCNTDFLEIRSNNVSGALLGIYCGKNKPLNITHVGTLWLLYKSSKLDSGAIVLAKGFYGEYKLNDYNELSGPRGTIASPMYPQSYYDYGTFAWKITVAPRKRILLSFKDFYVESYSDECFSANFMVYDGVDETAPELKSICGIELPDPIKSSTNILYITMEYSYVRMGSKFLVEWLEISNERTNISSGTTNKDCGSSEVIDINTVGSYDLTSPGYPNGYKNNLNCEWIFSTISMNHLMVYIIDMNLKNFYGRVYFCNDDYVSLYQKRSKDNDWELVKKICNTEEQQKNYQFTNLLKVQFVTNRYLNGTGFKLNVEQICGGSMTGPTGFIYFNRTAISRSGCEWNVTVRSGKTIKVTFEEMNIAHDPTKGCDNYIMLRNGKYQDSSILGNGKYCGTDIPEPLNTTGNYLYIKYYGSLKIKGFKLKYQEISMTCGGEILLSSLDNSTEINSPNFPNIPLPHTECSWMVRAPPDKSLRIDFEDRFDLTNRAQCEVEYVEVRDGGTELSPLIGRYCKEVPHTQFSTGNMMFVKFFTNTEDPRNGFKAKISLAYCGGTLRGLEGEIRNPSQQHGEEKRNCTWHISGPTDHYLNIQFVELKMHGTFAFPNKNKITIFEKNSLFNNVTKLGEYTGTTVPQLLLTSSNEAIINYIGTNKDKFQLRFNASQSECGGVMKAESGTITSPGYPVMNHLNRYCQWTIEVPEGRRITVDFVDFDLDETILYDQSVAVLDGSIPFKIPLAYLRPGASKKTFETSSNKMMIIFWSDRPSLHRGFKATFSANKPTICSSDFNSDSGVLTQPAIRNSSYWCHWTHKINDFINKTLSLKINLIVNSTRRLLNFNCTYSPWSITVMNQDERHILASLCKPTVKDFIVRSPFPVTKVTAIAKSQMNFTVDYNTYDCGGIIEEQQGFLSSPNYPSKSSKSLECAWLIKVYNDQTISLTMLNMSLGNDCDKNFITVYNGEGPSHPMIGKYCKTDKPNVIISQSNSLWMEYKYEADSSGIGFKLKYEAKSEGCGGIYHDRNRFIQTPNYGKDYPNNAECLWEIRANPGYSIGLQFIGRFQIEDSDNCANDYLEVWDWRDEKWISIAKRCGRNIPTDIKSTGEKLKILFRSNEKTTASGFKARWEWFCGGTFEATKTPRSIVSPGYPLIYTSNLNCVYNITTKAEVLDIVFDDFELENGATSCIYDNVTISGKYYSTYAALIATYCGTAKPPPLRVRENVIITFKTDKWVNRKGFKFTYSDESCGGDINETTVIEAPSIDYGRSSFRYYHPRIKCIWKITAPPKQVAILRVLYLALPSICLGQGLEIYNGLNDQRPNRLASLCGNISDSEQLIHADSGKMLVKLMSSPFRYGGFKAEVYFSHGSAEGCGGTINLTDTKYIQAPDLENLDCRWIIIAPRDYQIKIQFTELNIPSACNSNVTFPVFCTCSYIEVRDGGGPLSELIEKLCSHLNQNVEYRKFSTSSNYGYIRFVLAGRQNNAFKATLTPVISKCGPSILNATKEIKTLSSPYYPNNYPSGTKCTWLISVQNALDKIELHFSDFNLTGSGDYFITDNRCDDDRLEISEDPNRQIITEGFGPQAVYNSPRRTIFLTYNNVQGKHTFCGAEESPFDYYSIGRSLTITFRSLITSKTSKGFKIEYRTAGCNRNYTSLQGRIFSSNDKSECFITITVPENRTISLYFQKMVISHSFNCKKAAFEVRDNGPNGTTLMRSCGVRIPDPVFSYTNKLYVHIFNEDVSPYMLSYDVGYTSTDAGRGCGGELYNYGGWVSSPLYPNEFRNSTVCTWTLRVPVGLNAVLKFTSFELQGSCEQNYVTVNTFSSDGTTSHKFCKDDRPAILRSNSKIEIVYGSSVHNGGRGWLAKFQGLTDDTAEIF
ncbi:cubilin-like [Anoplophora glabripennis]|uniref:cubilin-like n=1 Tax=Anoplophora glabripennis TaxID=217634 RepID=UPI000873CC01|nr:cubilin-like [Anoplophora glabripennis]